MDVYIAQPSTSPHPRLQRGCLRSAFAMH